MRLTRAERETVITWNDADEYAEISTSSAKTRKRLTELKGKNAEITVIDADDTGVKYRIPKRFIKVSIPYNLSDEERARRRESMMRMLEVRRDGTV